MSILLTPNSRVVVQNVQSRYARPMLAQMRASGTNIVAGVSAGAGGTVYLDLPIFDTVNEAVAATGADTSVIYSPPFAVADAIIEAADAGIGLAVAAAEHAPIHDIMAATAHARKTGMWLVGPNALGMLSPGIGMLCGLPPAFGLPGNVGVISRSGTLTLATLRALTAAGIGQSTVVSIGGDMIIGRRPAEYVQLFAEDTQTRAVVMVGEIGGGKEDEVAGMLENLSIPVVAMIVGRSAPQGRQLGHAGALARSTKETAGAKAETLASAGAHLCISPRQVVETLQRLPGLAA